MRNSIYQGNGGIIYCSGIQTNMIVNECFFFQCGCNDQGGAIFFSCNFIGTNVELNKNCAKNCFSNAYQFAIILTHSNSNNLCNLLSMNNCNNISIGYRSFLLAFGNISLNNFNSTKNFNIYYSGIALLTNFKCYSNYCNIIENFASDYSCIQLDGIDNNFLNFYNIIKNNSPNNYGIITNWQGNFLINNIILINNINILFYLKTGQLNINNCKIFHQNYSLSNFNINSNNEFLLNYSINLIIINHFNCEINNIKNTIKKIYFLDLFKLMYLNLFL